MIRIAFKTGPVFCKHHTMHPLRVLYDGWPLITQANSPSALHLLAILAQLPEQVDPVIALPGEFSFQKRVGRAIHPTPDTPSGRLRWQQRVLPRLARANDAQLLHLTSPGAPLFAKTRVVVSPCGYDDLWSTVQGSQVQDSSQPFWERLRLAAAQGGLARVGALLWPDDLPPPDQRGAVHSLPPTVHPDFFLAESDHNTAGTLSDLDLPDTYVLYHGPVDQRSLRRLLAAWRWAAEPVGDYHPLLLLGLDADARTQLGDLMSEHEFGDTIIPLPPLSPERILTLYRGCSALFHPATVPPWGGAVRHALACGRPVVAAESPLASALVGPAAYLAPVDDPRALGAALITVVVEEEVAGDLAKAAKKRAAGWRMETFGERLVGVYERLGSRG